MRGRGGTPDHLTGRRQVAARPSRDVPPRHLPPRPQAATEGINEDPAAQALAVIAAEAAACTACPLFRTRRNNVPGEGSAHATLMFVGEGPGAEEDRLGRPFVGVAGELLTRIIGAMNLRREEVFIANAVKCRPPQNRTPTPAETLACRAFLIRQIRAIRPKVICALGRPAANTLLQDTAPISAIRGRFFEIAVTADLSLLKGAPVAANAAVELPAEGEPLRLLVLPTFHPAYLLRNPADKRLVWEDVQKIVALLQKAQ
ncbi:MAG: uracil-DNA glycosylase [Candidatus Schekmanbacteria bacterium]|nr:uracil-DNA glycosylase [Candidatus Schekmanbacteria bacterium]